MNIVEMYEFELELLLDREKEVQDKINKHSQDLNEAFNKLKDIKRQKQELKEDFENEIRFRSNNVD